MDNSIQIIVKPEWISWDDIHNVLWKAHEKNRESNIIMTFPSLPGEIIKEKIGKRGKMFVALRNNILIGTAAIKIKQQSLWCGKREYVHCCFASVLPEYNGLGIYKRFNLIREEEAKKMGFHHILFDTHIKNDKVIKINKKNGFKKVDISIRKGHKNVILVKWLDGCPYPNFYCSFQFFIHKWYRIIRCKL